MIQFKTFVIFAIRGLYVTNNVIESRSGINNLKIFNFDDLSGWRKYSTEFSLTLSISCLGNKSHQVLRQRKLSMLFLIESMFALL